MGLNLKKSQELVRIAFTFWVISLHHIQIITSFVTGDLLTSSSWWLTNTTKNKILNDTLILHLKFLKSKLSPEVKLILGLKFKKSQGVSPAVSSKLGLKLIKSQMVSPAVSSNLGLKWIKSQGVILQFHQIWA